MIFGVRNGEYVGLSLDNERVNRSSNVLVIGGTGTGKTYKYVKPNILQENCSQVITDPSGDIFRSFAPYLMTKGYNCYLFNVSDLTFSNHFNPLENVYDAEHNIVETQVDILVNLYMKNAKSSSEAGKSSGDPFWDSAEKAFLTALIYYALEEDEDKLCGGFDVEVEAPKQKSNMVKGASQEPQKTTVHCNGYEGGRCFSTILFLAQEAKVSDDKNAVNPLKIRMENFFKRKPNNKCHKYYETFSSCQSEKTSSTIVLCTTVDLQLFATEAVDRVTRTNKRYPDMNIDLRKIGAQQSYLFLGIPLDHTAYNFLIAMLQSQLFSKLYETGASLCKGKWHIGYRVGTPIFDWFDSEEEAKIFYETVSMEHIDEEPYINGQKIYKIKFNGKTYKVSPLKSALEKLINDIDQMVIWDGDKVGSEVALPIHVNLLLDEFKNIGEIPNFLTYLATVRKYRIGCHIIIQDIPQLETMYKDNEFKTVLANVDTTIFLGSILNEDKEFIQKLLGETTIKQRSTSDSKSGKSTSWTPTKVFLMSIDEISAINDPNKNRDDCIVAIRDVPPIVCRKLLLNEHCRSKQVGEASKELKKTMSGNGSGNVLEMYFRNNLDGNVPAGYERGVSV